MDEQWSRGGLPALPEMMLRGAAGRCPACGHGGMFRGYLRVVGRCAACTAPLGTMRADDAPPYITILITAHVTVGVLLLADRQAPLPVWLTVIAFAALAGIMALVLLRPIKGMTVAVLLRLAGQADEQDRGPHPDAARDDAAADHQVQSERG